MPSPCWVVCLIVCLIVLVCLIACLLDSVNRNEIVGELWAVFVDVLRRCITVIGAAAWQLLIWCALFVCLLGSIDARFFFGVSLGAITCYSLDHLIGFLYCLITIIATCSWSFDWGFFCFCLGSYFLSQLLETFFLIQILLSFVLDPDSSVARSHPNRHWQAFCEY